MINSTACMHACVLVHNFEQYQVIMLFLYTAVDKIDPDDGSLAGGTRVTIYGTGIPWECCLKCVCLVHLTGRSEVVIHECGRTRIARLHTCS